MWTARSLVFIALCFGAALPARGGHTLNAAEQQTLETWLTKHPAYRLAMDEDCDCADDIRQMKAGSGGTWKPVPDYHPYLATGDFNGDGAEDFAVVVVDRSKRKHNFVLIVFNGPFPLKIVAPTFMKAGLDLTDQGLFYGPPRPKPYRLVQGPFESEGWVLVPHGHGYRLSGE
jgi:hypothetical protein